MSTPLVVFVLLAGLLGARLWSGADPAAVPSTFVGKPAPQIDLPPLKVAAHGGSDTRGLSQEMLAGAPSVVNFWASWCGPCRIEHPQLMELSRQGKVRVLGVNYKDTPDNARRFLGQLGNPYEAVGVDRDGSTAVNWGVYGVPETFIIDAKGVIRHRLVGPLTQEALNGAFGAALAEVLPR